jgi:hypothetical protein
MAVRLGLESCGTEFAIVIQHDRKFKKTINDIDSLINVMVMNFFPISYLFVSIINY